MTFGLARLGLAWPGQVGLVQFCARRVLLAVCRRAEAKKIQSSGWYWLPADCPAEGKKFQSPDGTG